MILFLDTSVLLAACGSETGASRWIFRLAKANRWQLVVTAYVVTEVERNLPAIGPEGQCRSAIGLVPDVWTVAQLTVFPVAKDRPVLFSAFAWSDVLLTLDSHDFARLLGFDYYGMAIMKPSEFLMRERQEGRLVQPTDA